MSKTFRFLGSQLESNDLYLDVEIVRINLDGDAILRDVTPSNSDPSDIPDGEDPYQFAESEPGYWILGSDRIKQLQSDGLAVDHSDIDVSSQVWQHLSNIHSMRNNQKLQNAGQELDSTITDLYRIVTEAHKADLG